MSSQIQLRMSKEIRIYLSTRAAHCIAEIDKLHRELECLNRLMRLSHLEDHVKTVPPIVSPPVPQQDEIITPRPLTPRPRLHPSKSNPMFGVWPEPTAAKHPALRSAVPSQSRYPRFPTVSIKAESPVSGFPFPLMLNAQEKPKNT